MILVPAWLFAKAENATRAEIFGWWEARRLRYNVLVGSTGAITWILVLVAGSAAMKPGADFEEPMAMILGPVIYGLLANLFYTSGAIFDTIVYRKSPRVGLFKFGLIFSIALTALPGVWAVTAWLITVFTGEKMG